VECVDPFRLIACSSGGSAVIGNADNTEGGQLTSLTIAIELARATDLAHGVDVNADQTNNSTPSCLAIFGRHRLHRHTAFACERVSLSRGRVPVRFANINTDATADDRPG